MPNQRCKKRKKKTKMCTTRCFIRLRMRFSLILNSKGNSFHWGGGTPQDNEINIFLGGNYTNDM